MKNLPLATATLVLFGTLSLAINAYAAGQYKLNSQKLKAPITLEASNKAWENLPELSLTLSQTPYKPAGFPGLTRTKVKLKSLYDSENLYIHMQYDDPTKSLNRFPWIKQKDGTWKQSVNKDSTGHENDFYEDKVGMFWDINTNAFAQVGCMVSCHITNDGLNNGIPDKSAGRKYTNADDETIDMWHWKSVRTGLAFDLSHDQYVDNVTDPKKNKNWGRHGDEKTGGGYKNNTTKDKKMPMYMNKNKNSQLSYLKDEDKVPFIDTFKTGDMIPGIVVSKMSGSAADIKTSSKYENGKWTLVFKRALVTTHPKAKVQDVQFDDLSKSYHFGVAVFDNTQINHMYHFGSIELKFK